MSVGVHGRDDQGAGLDVGKFTAAGTANLEHDIRGESLGRVGQTRAVALIIRVGDARLEARAALDRDLGAEADELLHRFRGGRDPRFSRIGFRDNPNQHDFILNPEFSG
jgi:hypothetical protein